MKKIYLIPALNLFYIVILYSSISLADSSSDVAVVVIPAWDSRYVSEGRDNLDTGGLFSFDISTTLRQLTLGGWFALGDSESYQEVQPMVGI